MLAGNGSIQRPTRARWRRITLTALGLLSLASAAAAILAPGAQASYFNPAGLYDCTSTPPGGGITYIDSYQFKSDHRYSVGVLSGGHLGGHIVTDTYKISGDRIIGLSGVLKQDHESLLIQKSDLALLDNNGHFTGVGCRLHGAKPPPPTNLVGTYGCYYTTQYSPTGYSSAFLQQLQLYSDKTYQWGNSLRYPSAWHQSGNSLVFSEGPLWSDTAHAHDVGAYYSGGVSMPHAQSNVPSSGYTLVIKDTVREGGVPPSQEFSSTDGVGGSSSLPMSFAYCKKS